MFRALHKLQLTRHRTWDTLLHPEYVNRTNGMATIANATQVMNQEQKFPEMNAYLALHDQSSIGSKWGGGDLMYRDLNNDGRVDKGSQTLDDHGDLKVIGNSTPRYAYSITLDAKWKFLDVRAFFQGIAKRDFFFTNSDLLTGCFTAPRAGACRG